MPRPADEEVTQRSTGTPPVSVDPTAVSRFDDRGAQAGLTRVLPRGVQRMLAPLVELVLEPQTFLVRLDGADRLHDGIDPRLRLERAELARRDGAFAGVVVRESRVPPDAGVQAVRQL